MTAPRRRQPRKPRSTAVGPRSIGELIFRADARGCLLPDPLDFLWRFVVEHRASVAGRSDRGWSVYTGSVPGHLVPTAEALPEWMAAADLLVWRYQRNQRSGRRRHLWATQGYYPDHALIVPGRPCGPLSVCLATPTRPEIAARRFSRWLHAVHELAVCEWRLRRPNEAIIVPWTLAGPADPLPGMVGDWRER